LEPDVGKQSIFSSTIHETSPKKEIDKEVELKSRVSSIISDLIEYQSSESSSQLGDEVAYPMIYISNLEFKEVQSPEINEIIPEVSSSSSKKSSMNSSSHDTKNERTILIPTSKIRAQT